MSGRDSPGWRPSASWAALQRRAGMLAELRRFFAARGVLEVETPILGAAAGTDPHIEPLRTVITGIGNYYLHTSPEFAMKRLLAAGSGDIYQVCKVFRDDEHGRWHNPEFTLVEWYRRGFDEVALMGEVHDLAAQLLAPQRRLETSARTTYALAMREHAGVDAFRDDDLQLERAVARHGISCGGQLDRDAKLDLLMGMVVGPKLGFDRPCFICDYPASQASLARVKAGQPAVAARFELYIDGLEIANGFHELADAVEQERRFARDLEIRRSRGQSEPVADTRLLAALRDGLPDCAGVALGFDRLVAVALQATRLAESLSFPIDTA
ncbi:MAG: elongation factor P--(R)-beta-lysine ligase [Steroidobacteraceae bacterium]